MVDWCHHQEHHRAFKPHSKEHRGSFFKLQPHPKEYGWYRVRQRGSFLIQVGFRKNLQRQKFHLRNPEMTLIMWPPCWASISWTRSACWEEMSQQTRPTLSNNGQNNYILISFSLFFSSAIQRIDENKAYIVGNENAISENENAITENHDTITGYHYQT